MSEEEFPFETGNWSKTRTMEESTSSCKSRFNFASKLRQVPKFKYGAKFSAPTPNLKVLAFYGYRAFFWGGGA